MIHQLMHSTMLQCCSVTPSGTMNIATDIVIAIEKEISQKKMLKVLSIVVDLSKKVFLCLESRPF